MKRRILLALLTALIVIPLAGCPKKKNADEAGVEQAEGSSSADKSGEGASEEMKEKPGGSSDAPATEPEKKD